jgi:hypothetical protein
MYRINRISETRDVENQTSLLSGHPVNPVHPVEVPPFSLTGNVVVALILRSAVSAVVAVNFWRTKLSQRRGDSAREWIPASMFFAVSPWAP